MGARPGPPAGAPPPAAEPPKELFTKVKPPPMAPPPRELIQTIQRPDLENVKTIDPTRFTQKAPAPMPAAAGPRPPTGGPRPPPRPAPPPLEAMDVDNEGGFYSAQGGEGLGKGIPPPKFSNLSRMPSKKGAAIKMFENPDPEKITAPIVRAPRPAPPSGPPPGIPAGEPLPPSSQPPVVSKPPPPLRPPPTMKGRGPPVLEPEEEISPLKKVKLAPPPEDVEPPTKKGVKPLVVKVERILQRHEKEFPEFEESDDEAEDRKREELAAAARAKEDAELAAKAAALLAATELATKEHLVKAESKNLSAEAALLQKAQSEKSLLPAGEALSRASSQAVMEVGADGSSPMKRGPSQADLKRGPSQAALQSSPSKADLMKSPSQKSLKPQDSVKIISEEAAPPVVVEPAKADEDDLEAEEMDAEPDAQKFHKQRGISAKVIDSKAPPLLETPTVTSLPADPMAGFVPPPPVSKEQTDSKLASMTKGGRVSIRCISGEDIRRRDDKSKVARIDPYLKLRLGAAEKFPWKQSKTKRKQDQFPKFDNEIIAFDMIDPAPYIYDDNIELTCQVWNKAALRDEFLGQVSISIVNFLLHPFISFEERLPLTLPGARGTCGKIFLEFVFEEARVGIFLFTLYEARGLRNVNPMGKQNPYVQLSLATYLKKSKVIRDNSRDPYFAEEEILMWVDKENWVNDLKVALLDEELGGDAPIGLTNLCLLPYMNIKASDAKDETFELFYLAKGATTETAQGEAVMKIQYLPAGVLTVQCIRAKGLVPVDKNARTDGAVQLDSYACFTLEGQASKMVKRSSVDKDGGPDPLWNSELKFDIVDQYLLDVSVFDQDIAGNDVLLGSAQISLLPTFKSGQQNFWVTLKARKEGGGIREAGDINLMLSFIGPPGVFYPQHRPGVDAFDDSLRVGGAVGEAKQIAAAAQKKAAEDDKKKRAAGAAVPSNAAGAESSKVQTAVPRGMEEDAPPEFTEEEVQAAFKFIDLDKNNFIGAAEIRHILVCMGELITDEEIDMMIAMVDLDGDGQISIDEFRTLVLHPNPGDIDVQKLVADKKMEELDKKLQMEKGKQADMDQESYQRQKEIKLRESKKKLVVEFLRENELVIETLKHSYGRFVEIPKETRLLGRLDFSQFCAVLKQEPVGENLRLFSLFDPERTGTIDFREFLLTSMNFIEVPKEDRLRFIFTMFDEEKTGYISLKEVEQILKGNHIASLASVQRKAQTIMKQTGNETNSINLNEFIVVAKKFPNIMFPAVNPGVKKDSETN